METNEISAHLFKVYSVLAAAPAWMTAAQVADTAGVAPRTARAHVLRLVRAGLADQAEVFPAHRYRLAPKARQRNRGFIQRLEAARDIFGDAG